MAAAASHITQALKGGGWHHVRMPRLRVPVARRGGVPYGGKTSAKIHDAIASYPRLFPTSARAHLSELAEWLNAESINYDPDPRPDNNALGGVIGQSDTYPILLPSRYESDVGPVRAMVLSALCIDDSFPRGSKAAIKDLVNLYGSPSRRPQSDEAPNFGNILSTSVPDWATLESALREVLPNNRSAAGLTQLLQRRWNAGTTSGSNLARSTRPSRPRPPVDGGDVEFEVRPPPPDVVGPGVEDLPLEDLGVEKSTVFPAVPGPQEDSGAEELGGKDLGNV